MEELTAKLKINKFLLSLIKIGINKMYHQSYKVMNNSFDGVDVLNVNTCGSTTSCFCGNCVKGNAECCSQDKFTYNYNPLIARGPESNNPLSCALTDFSCVNNQVYANSVQPTLLENPQNIITLNKSFGLTYTPGFFNVDSACGGQDSGYTTIFDPRLVRQDGLKITLDRPPLWGQVDLKNIYDKQYEGYGKNYKGYRDINTGQIQYYYDKSDADPYFQPLYTIQSHVTHSVFKDPMDSLKPYYYKRPVNETLRNVSEYSETRDTLSFREDLMSKQSELMNRSNWTHRWVSPTNNN